MNKFYVVGGEYTDTTFTKFRKENGEEVFGPFETYEEAKKEWQKQSWAHVDFCLYRYRVVEASEIGMTWRKALASYLEKVI